MRFALTLSKIDLAWLDKCFTHSGAKVRLQLRCEAVPLMSAVGARMRVQRELRHCLMCGSGAVEDAQHFVSGCSHVADLRKQCQDKLKACLGDLPAPAYRNAIDSCDPELFLGDRLLGQLPVQTAEAADSVVCNFLRLAWRRRQELWKHFCDPMDEWRLDMSIVPPRG